MHVAPLTQAELAALAPIAATAPDPFRPADLAALLHDPRRLCLVAHTGGVAGFACLRQDEGSAELEMLVVDPAHRRRGVGTALLAAALAAARAAAPRCLLEVRASNTAALRLYTAAGFRILARRPTLYALPTEDGLTLEIRFEEDA